MLAVSSTNEDIRAAALRAAAGPSCPLTAEEGIAFTNAREQARRAGLRQGVAIDAGVEAVRELRRERAEMAYRATAPEIVP